MGKPGASATEKLDVNGNVKAKGFKTPNGTATQALTANGGVFDLNKKADLVDGKVPSSQLPSYVDDVSNLVPYTGANKDVNLDSNYFKTSKGFDFTFDDGNYFRTYNNGSYNKFVFCSKENNYDKSSSIYVTANPEQGFLIHKIKGNGISNYFHISEYETYSKSAFIVTGKLASRKH